MLLIRHEFRLNMVMDIYYVNTLPLVFNHWIVDIADLIKFGKLKPTKEYLVFFYLWTFGTFCLWILASNP